MSAGVTFERVYHALKDQLGSARFAAGQHLEPATLSQDLNASITPVRDALHRLVGEGLVETPRGEGFRVPLVTEVGLRHLYRWNAALLGLTMRTASGTPAVVLEAAAGETVEPVELAERLFVALAARSGNPEHVAAIAGLNDRLRPIRHVELTVLPDPATELEEIASRLGEAAPPLLRRMIAAYHRRRERMVAQIVAARVAPH
jgi:DNA-binding GntR family transcriptional regulator